MTIENILKFFKNYKTGTYASIEKVTNKNGFVKRVLMVCRFVNYYNIKQVKEANKKPTHKEYERVIIPHILKQNTNTNNTLLMVYLTNNHRQKAKTTYFYNDKPITETDYYNGINEKKRANVLTPVMSFNISDIVALGGVQ